MKLKNVSDPGWAEIAKLGWGHWSNDFHRVGKLLWRLYTPETIVALRMFVGVRVSELYKRVAQWEIENDRRLKIGSDDGFSDVLHHVVGMGKSEFRESFADPTRLERRYNSKYGSPEGYKESFLYCFHDDIIDSK